MHNVVDRVLCVDLDGTLVATDLLWESLWSAIRVRPWALFLVPLWLLRGRPYLKRRLAEAASIDFATLPYRPEVLAFVQAERHRGRPVVLATASDYLLAEGVSQHLGVFDDVLASDGVTNLKGRVKAQSLVGRFGSGNFDYIGDSRSDVPCWVNANDAITTGAMKTSQVAHLRRLSGRERRVVDDLAAITAALRPHQWLKNLLLFVPAIAAHRFDWITLQSIILAFVSLSLVASGGYVLNDLLDLKSDRQHPRKRNRPFAAGRLSLRAGATLVASSWLVGFGLTAAALPLPFLLVLVAYLIGTASYSLRLKREPVLDVMFLAGLYVLRIVGGGAATAIPVSTWLLAFTLFVCLSLALMKRFIEVSALRNGGNADIPGRGYFTDDAQWLQAAGLASAYMSVVVLAIYVNSSDVSRLYSHPERLLLVCPVLLYWATRAWVYAHRRQMHDDPMVSVAYDRATYLVLAISITIVFFAK
jgi:4-hydroxybenzoate polyprenyltransferase